MEFMYTKGSDSMAEIFSFFDPVLLPNGLPDRDYNAQEFTDYFGDLVTTGIMKGASAELKVMANGSNMITEIDTGIAFVEGKRYANTAKKSHTHDTETLGKDRIDRIVIRKDLNTDARHVKSFIKKGIASANPVPPALTRNEMVYEISLAQVKIIGGQTYISAANVVDERGKDDICPWAGSKILPNFDDSSIGEPNGIATLDANGSVPMEQLQNVPLPQDASVTQKGVVQLSSNISSTSTDLAATINAVRIVNDMKADREQEPTITITAQNGWLGTTPIRVYKDEFGVVHVSGMLWGGTKTAGTVLFTLPVEYRPSSLYTLSTPMGIPTNSTATDGRIVSVKIENGAVTLTGTALDNLYCYFSFRT